MIGDGDSIKYTFPLLIKQNQISFWGSDAISKPHININNVSTPHMMLQKRTILSDASSSSTHHFDGMRPWYLYGFGN